MVSKRFQFNIGAKYQPGPQKAPTSDVGNLADGRVQVQADVPHEWFEVKYPDVFQKYRLPYVKSDAVVRAWYITHTRFWQNQLNFAVWCATTGCGVSRDDHLGVGGANEGLLRSVFRFHVYYQTRRILREMRAPLPQDRAFDVVNNPYDVGGYERICNEFGVSPYTSDWRVPGPNQGLGRVYTYWTRGGYRPYGDGEYDPRRMSFTQRTTNSSFHVDFIKQDAHNADTAWKTFILDKSEGFTQPGVERINDSIRTYVWAILGAQAQTRTGILGAGTAFDAQKQFLANVEDAIASPVDLGAAIARYQDVLQYARSEVNYSFGTGLYMAPSDMLLRVGTTVGYNNLIVIATAAQSLGLNSGLNKHEPHALAPPDADTGERGLVKPPKHPAPTHPAPTHPAPTHPAPTHPAPTHPAAIHPPHDNPPLAKQKTATHPAAPPHASDHEDEKTALVVGGVAIGLLALWLLRR